MSRRNEKKGDSDNRRTQKKLEEKKRLLDDKEVRKKSIENVKVGHRDINNEMITRVHMSYETFVIYEVDTPILTDTLRTFFYTLDNLPEEQEVVKNLDKIAASQSDAEEVMSKAVDKNLFKGRMAYAIGKALLGDVPEAHKMLRDLIDQTNSDYSEQIRNKSLYRVTALIASLIIAGIAFYVGMKEPFAVALLNKLFYIAAGGAIGGFLSMALSIRNMIFEKGLTWGQVIIYALERLLFSIFAACVVAVAVKLDLVFGFLKSLNNSKSSNISVEGYVIAAVIAGFSETFLPNLLAKLEKKS